MRWYDDSFNKGTFIVHFGHDDHNWGHRRVFPETYAKPITPRYQRVAQTTVWLTVWPQTEKSRDFCCSTRLSNGLAWQQDQATALSVGFWEDSLMTPDSVAFRFIAANDHPDHDTIATFRPLSQGDRSSVRSSAAAGAGDGRSEDGDGGAGRYEDSRQRQPAQRAAARAGPKSLPARGLARQPVDASTADLPPAPAWSKGDRAGRAHPWSSRRCARGPARR